MFALQATPPPDAAMSHAGFYTRPLVKMARTDRWTPRKVDQARRIFDRYSYRWMPDIGGELDGIVPPEFFESLQDELAEFARQVDRIEKTVKADARRVLERRWNRVWSIRTVRESALRKTMPQRKTWKAQQNVIAKHITADPTIVQATRIMARINARAETLKGDRLGTWEQQETVRQYERARNA